jgi:hypothetical protein
LKELARRAGIGDNAKSEAPVDGLVDQKESGDSKNLHELEVTPIELGERFDRPVEMGDRVVISELESPGTILELEGSPVLKTKMDAATEGKLTKDTALNSRGTKE